MNIFVLDEDPARCARCHMDRHVVKMILESAQMLCTVVVREGGRAPYKPTHARHPCTLWAGESLQNWRWLRSLTLALNREFRYRFHRDRDHASAAVVRGLWPPPLPRQGRTPFAQAMPKVYQRKKDAVGAYRAYYIAEKRNLAVWTRRRRPVWFPLAD